MNWNSRKCPAKTTIKSDLCGAWCQKRDTRPAFLSMWEGMNTWRKAEKGGRAMQIPTSGAKTPSSKARKRMRPIRKTDHCVGKLPEWTISLHFPPRINIRKCTIPDLVVTSLNEHNIPENSKNTENISEIFQNIKNSAKFATRIVKKKITFPLAFLMRWF